MTHFNDRCQSVPGDVFENLFIQFRENVDVFRTEFTSHYLSQGRYIKSVTFVQNCLSEYNYM